MKKPLITFPALLATVFLLAGCTKDEARHQVYFATNSTKSSETLNLFVDGKHIGQLPGFGENLTCQNDSLKAQALFLNLKSGKYWLEAKNSQGVVKASSKLQITDSGLGSKGGVGGISATSDTRGCVTVNLF